MDTKQNFSALLAKVILPKVEIIAAVITSIGFVLNYMKQPAASQLVMIGLSTLASVFFVTGFLLPPPIEKTLSEETPKTFIDLLALIIWKVMHMALAIATIGLLFYLLHLKGFSQMMLIGTMTLAVTLLLSGLIILQKNNFLLLFKTTLIKALMMVIIGTYILYINWALITS
jgi:hypothetical protein